MSIKNCRLNIATDSRKMQYISVNPWLSKCDKKDPIATCLPTGKIGLT